MRRVFKDRDGNKVDEIKHCLEVLKNKSFTKIYVGSDSQKKRKTIEYAVVIAFRYGNRGAHYIFSKWNVSRKGYGKGDQLIEKRLQEEVATTMEIVSRLQENSISVYQIDFDLNCDPKWKSHKFVQMATGWGKAMGCNVSIKPDVQVATKAANHIVNQ